MPKVGLVSYRFQTNAPTRYIVNPNCGILSDDNPVTVKVELVGNRYNPQHKLILQAALIKNEDDWQRVWEDPKIGKGEGYQSLWIELSTTVMNLEQAHNLTEQETVENVAAAVGQLLSASSSKGAAKVKELEDLKSLLDADIKTILKNIEQTNALKSVIEKQLAERTSETAELRSKAEKMTAEEERLRAELMRDEGELRLFKDRRGGNPDNCVVM
ncbi:Major sperm protein [Trichostrongylus colubriformis]|uniref:Major sperm protein n=1 Tax=Trichostrongylus colubriformis TaxID=6319 RepID=A0AAN8J1F6_TRICO